MSTNYMTVNEYEMDLLNARLWRIRQAIRNQAREKDLGCPELDKKILKMRYRVTKLLLDVLFMENYVWECASDEEYKEWNATCPDPEELVKQFDFHVDEKMAKGRYRDELDCCGEFGPDCAYLDIYSPMKWRKDLPKSRKKEFNEAAKAALKSLSDLMKKETEKKAKSRRSK